MIEERKFRRIPFRQAVQFHVDEGPRLREEEGILPHTDPFPRTGGGAAQDLSEGGIRFQMNGFVPLDAVMTVTFFLGEREEQVSLSGHVIWVQKLPHAERYVVGFKFNEKTWERTEVKQFIDSQDPVRQ